MIALYSVLNDPYDFGSYFDVVKVTLLIIAAVVTAVGAQIFYLYRTRVKMENKYYHLSQKKKQCQEKGIRAEFYFQNYQGSTGQNKELLRQLMQTLDSAIRQVEKKKGEKYLKLQCSRVKGQIVLKVEHTGRKPESIMVGE